MEQSLGQPKNLNLKSGEEPFGEIPVDPPSGDLEVRGHCHSNCSSIAVARLSASSFNWLRFVLKCWGYGHIVTVSAL